MLAVQLPGAQGCQRTCRCRRTSARYGLRGRRVGEASHPGPPEAPQSSVTCQYQLGPATRSTAACAACGARVAAGRFAHLCRWCGRLRCGHCGPGDEACAAGAHEHRSTAASSSSGAGAAEVLTPAAGAVPSDMSHAACQAAAREASALAGDQGWPGEGTEEGGAAAETRAMDMEEVGGGQPCEWHAGQVHSEQATCSSCGRVRKKGNRVHRCAVCKRIKCKECDGPARCAEQRRQALLPFAVARRHPAAAAPDQPRGPAAATPQPPSVARVDADDELANAAAAPAPAASDVPAPPVPPDTWRRGRAQRRGVVCAHCDTERGRNTSVWTCEKCGVLLCPCCHRQASAECAGRHGRDQGADGAAAPATPRPAVQGEAGETDEARVADLLEDLTAKPRPRTLQWCARSLRPRVASLLEQAIAEAVLSSQTAPGTAWELQAHRWAWLLPSLLLRAPVESDPATSGTTAAITQMVRRRVQQAEASQWLALLEEALEDDSAAAAAATAAPAPQAPVRERAAELKRAQAAVTKARAGNLRGGIQVLTGEGVAEGTDDTMHKLRALVMEERAPADEEGELERQLAHARAALDAAGPARLYVRALRRRVRALRPGAAAGASGWRNSHILMVADTASGTGWLLEWSRLWATGALTGEVGQLWSRGVLVPLQRPDGKVRPIALTEVLLKLGESAIVDSVFPTLRTHFADRQFSVREPAGAEVVVGCARQWAAATPEQALVTTDLSNAYGCLSRARALRAVASACPAMLGPLLTQWAPGASTAWMRTPTGWTQWGVERGIWQGSPLANPVFCVPLQEALEAARKESAEEVGKDTQLGKDIEGIDELAYADDALFHGRPHAMKCFLPVLSFILEDYGWTLVWEKSHAWIPHFDGVEDLPAGGPAELCEMVTRCVGGIPLLGSAAEGEFSTTVGAPSAAEAPATKRVAAAERLCGELQALVVVGIAESPHHPAWAMLAKSAARRLDYDARVCPCEQLGRSARRLDVATASCLGRLLGEYVRDGALRQARLPGPLGGLGLRGVEASADAHFLARVRTTAARVCRITRAEEFVETAAGNQAASRLREAWGVVADGGKIGFTELAAAEVAAGPWGPQLADRQARDRDRHGLAPERLAGRLLAAVETVEATRLWEAMPQARTRLLSAGGAGVGTTWTAVPESERWLSSAQWRVGTLMRLGLWNQDEAMRCQLAGRGGVCGARLGCGAQHALDCKEAPSRIRLHKSIAIACADQLTRAQAEVGVEQAVPELGRWWRDEEGAWQCQDAVLDLVVSWPGAWLGRTLVDVTVRTPEAVRYQPGASTTPGAAAAKAADEKGERYPARHGAVVRTLAFEPLGRLGDEGRALLEDLAMSAAGVQADRTAAPALLRRWRMALEHTLVAGAADAVLRASGRAGTEAWERRAAPRLGRTLPGAPAPPAPTEEQRARAERNRMEALARREARLEAEAAAAELEFADEEDCADTE